MVEYLGELRESVLEAYTGIIQGLKGAGGEVMLSFIDYLTLSFYLKLMYTNHISYTDFFFLFIVLFVSHIARQAELI